ncbi:unnamed protein product [Notodromas monacha]|uniref:Uncharacterized protein n=1 Tax=Notodromas monacha TaxID=399045 RepID=A0A7R9BBM9_9CRUS|nr:unnamed protein product [Notodromas monacha]CAG0912270.1 unnamed protein product [Notodromas monacha]
MAVRLEIDAEKKKDPNQAIDLSKCNLHSRKEFDRAVERIPDLKIKDEKVRLDDVKIQQSQFSFFSSRTEVLISKNVPQRGLAENVSEYEFQNPVPTSMQAVRIEDVSTVDINWRMLTLARPMNKLEEEIFSRFVALDKLKRSSRQSEAGRVPPKKQIIHKIPREKGASQHSRGSKGGSAVPATRFPACKECNEELCNGGCKNFNYDFSTRIVIEDKEKDSDDKPQGMTLKALLQGSAGNQKKSSSKNRSSKVPRFRRKKNKKSSANSET